MLSCFEISDRFVHYYQGIGFELLPSASLLDSTIPMSFVMSAGLVQVEASMDRLTRSDGNAYVLRQNCFRHFDLDRVGKTNVHLALFEMPGAFVFGSISKTSTIKRMWDVVTKVLEIDPSCLWVTCFAGGTKNGYWFPPDGEAYGAWKQIGLPEERIVNLGPDDNFWMQGGGIDGNESRRKCGPNTELFYDLGETRSCGAECRPGCRCGRFVEFANALFIFAEADQETGRLLMMNNPFHETVIGTERVAMISQGKASVFEIDCMLPLVDKVRSFCNGAKVDGLTAGAVQIIVDYLKALLFLVADGAPPPGKGGRRRIIKLLIRGVLTQQQLLEIRSSDLVSELIDAVLAIYGGQHSHLFSGRKLLLDYFVSERQRFKRTLDRGYRQLARVIQSNGSAPGKYQVVDLVKRYGLPLSLIKLELGDRELAYDDKVYQDALLKSC